MRAALGSLSRMQTLLYIRLIGFTTGTLLMLFWMVVILGYRRQRNFERVFFFLCLALFLFYAGSLLAINARIYYAQSPESLNIFAQALICVGLIFLPPLLLHVHLEFADTSSRGWPRKSKRAVLVLAYAPALYFLGSWFPTPFLTPGFDLAVPGRSLGPPYLTWLFLLVFFSVEWDRKFITGAKDRPERRFYKLLWFTLGAALALILAVHAPFFSITRRTAEALATALALLPLIPLGLLIYYVQQHNFLNIGKQKNLLYAVSTTFLALLYLALVRRVSESLAATIPPEATAATLLFVLVIFIEPLQRALGTALRETAQRELEVAQRLAAEIHQDARHGDLERLRQFIELRIAERLGLRSARLEWTDLAGLGPRYQFLQSPAKEKPAAIRFNPREFSIVQSGKKLGTLRVEPHGAGISGDTAAALEFICQQLPAAFDLCGLIEEKLRLERELAERERMAVLGQMAASISHNLKNPLGSIKTILQLQIERPDLPENFRSESTMVLQEVNRLSSKLNQLLQFSRPAILGQPVPARCDVCEVLGEVTEVLRPEADRRGILLHSAAPNEPVFAAIGKAALNDILTNLLVNALDAVCSKGQIRTAVSQSNDFCVVTVEDDGPGIPPEAQDKILQPFFSTKAQGTGLGLAIVARRVTEAQGYLDCQSPVHDGQGTRFQVRVPASASS
jgi:signal transduction histidine kinase